MPRPSWSGSTNNAQIHPSRTSPAENPRIIPPSSHAQISDRSRNAAQSRAVTEVGSASRFSRTEWRMAMMRGMSAARARRTLLLVMCSTVSRRMVELVVVFVCGLKPGPLIEPVGRVGLNDPEGDSFLLPRCLGKEHAYDTPADPLSAPHRIDKKLDNEERRPRPGLFAPSRLPGHHEGRCAPGRSASARGTWCGGAPRRPPVRRSSAAAARNR